MTTRVAFLRAVNLGSRRVPMADLADVCTAAGCVDVQTFANSGNVIFEGNGSRSKLEQHLATAFEAAFGFEVTTFVRSARELVHAVNLRPFDVAGTDTYFVTFLASVPSASTVRELEASSNEFDTLVVDGRDVHWRMHGRSTETTITQATWSRLVGRHASTSRNITLLAKVASKAAP